VVRFTSFRSLGISSVPNYQRAKVFLGGPGGLHEELRIVM